MSTNPRRHLERKRRAQKRLASWFRRKHAIRLYRITVPIEEHPNEKEIN